jgi:hypothetical protein
LEQVFSLEYFGVDWAAMVFTFVAIYLLGNQSRAGFPVMMCGNSCWVVVGLLAYSAAMVLANVVFFLMNLRGLLRWTSSRNQTGQRDDANV